MREGKHCFSFTLVKNLFLSVGQAIGTRLSATHSLSTGHTLHWLA